MMRPGQLTPNEFECAILERITSKEPSIRRNVSALRVLSREFTGVGSFTKFKCDEPSGPPRRLSLDAVINMPGVRNGIGAVLFCEGHEPVELEVFTFGDDPWDGQYDGFSIEAGA